MLRKLRLFIFSLFNNPYFILFLINLFFFFPLFFPKLKLIITPEYGGGDENIFHYPIKYLLQQKLKNNQFLFWSNLTGGGYPLYAISELGFFNPINIITLKYLPFSLAINVQIFIYFLVLLFGSYYLGTILKFKKIINLFFSISFSYCFFIIANIIHLSHLASFSFIPLIFALLLKIIGNNKITIHYYLFTVVLALQLIAGHQQYFFYSVILIFSYLFIEYLLNKNKRPHLKKIVFLISLAFFISLLLGAIQLVPSFQYLKYSNSRNFHGDTKISLNNLLTLIHPFILYRPDLKDASKKSNYTAPWDSNFFLGTSVYLLIFLLIFKRKLINLRNFLKKNYNFIVLIFLSFLLLLGQNSPIYFIYEFPPFSLFRVPERLSFIFLFLLLIVIFDFINNYVKYYQLIIYTSIILNLLINFYIMYNFHIFIDEKNFLKKTQFNHLIENNYQETNQRILSLFFYEFKNVQLLYEKGLKNELFKDLTLVKNGMVQNFPAFYNIKNFNLPTSALNLRSHIFYYINLFEEYNEKYASLSGRANFLIKNSNIGYIISPMKITNLPTYLSLSEKNNFSGQDFYLYRSNFNQNLIGFSNNIDYYQNSLDFFNKITTDEEKIYIKGNDVIKTNKKILPEFNYQIVKFTDDEIIIKIRNNTDGVFFISNNYYPYWKGYLNNKEKRILQANLLFQAMAVPKGEHLLKFKYQPDDFVSGFLISLISLIIFTVANYLIIKKAVLFP